MQELGTGPKTLPELPAHILKLAKEQRENKLPPLFRKITVTAENVFKSNMKSNTLNIVKQQFTDDTGLSKNGWTAWKNCMEIPAGYCKIGDIFMRYRYGQSDFRYLNADWLTDLAEVGSDILVVHKSICLTVPSVPIVDVRNGRMIFAPDPAAYNTDLYTPLGAWCGPRGWEMPCTVVLKCFLRAEVNKSSAYRIGELNEGDSRQLDFYRIMQDTVNTWLPVVETRNERPMRVVYNQGGPELRLVRKADSDRTPNSVALVLYDILMHCMDQFTGDTLETYASKYDAVWQGWRNVGVSNTLGDPIKNSTINETRATAFMIAYCRTSVDDRPDSISIGSTTFDFRTICACYDAAEQTRLSAIHPSMRLACHSAACLNGGPDVFKIGVPDPSKCEPLVICNQSVNVQADVADLKNITLSCNAGAATGTPGTDALNDSDAAAVKADAAKARESANDLQALADAAKRKLAALEAGSSAAAAAQAEYEKLQNAATNANKAATQAELQAFLLEQKSTAAPPNYIMYAGIGMAVAITLIFMVVGVILWRRRRQRVAK